MHALSRYADLVQFPRWGGGELVTRSPRHGSFPRKAFWGLPRVSLRPAAFGGEDIDLRLRGTISEPDS